MADLFSESSVFRKVFLFCLMFVPSIVTYIALQSFVDAILTTACTILIGYGIPLLLIRLLLDKTGTSKGYFGEGGSLEGFIGKGIIHGLMWGVIIGVVLILYCVLLNWGPRSITLPMPFYTGNSFYFYWIGFFLIWVVVLPIVEDTFWLFQLASWSQPGSDLAISLLHALMNFTWLYQIVDPEESAFIITAIFFVVCYGSIKIRQNGSPLLLHGLRTGMGLGIFLMLVYLNSTDTKYKSPRYYLRANINNKWKKWT